jgi:integrase/recombinase XerD
MKTTIPKHIRRKSYKHYYMPTEEEVRQMLNAPDLNTSRGIRDRAMLELAYSSGLRRGELLRLNINDIDFTENLVTIRNSKKNRDRVVPFGVEAKKYILLYLNTTRKSWIKDQSVKALFITQYGKRFKKLNNIYDTLKIYAPNPKICLHSLRVAAAIHMLKRGATIPILQAFLGHASAETTQVYTRLYPKDVIEAYRRVKLR